MTSYPARAGKKYSCRDIFVPKQMGKFVEYFDVCFLLLNPDSDHFTFFLFSGLQTPNVKTQMSCIYSFSVTTRSEMSRHQIISLLKIFNLRKSLVDIFTDLSRLNHLL